MNDAAFKAFVETATLAIYILRIAASAGNDILAAPSTLNKIKPRKSLFSDKRSERRERNRIHAKIQRHRDRVLRRLGPWLHALLSAQGALFEALCGEHEASSPASAETNKPTLDYRSGTSPSSRAWRKSNAGLVRHLLANPSAQDLHIPLRDAGSDPAPDFADGAAWPPGMLADLGTSSYSQSPRAAASPDTAMPHPVQAHLARVGSRLAHVICSGVGSVPGATVADPLSVAELAGVVFACVPWETGAAPRTTRLDVNHHHWFGHAGTATSAGARLPETQSVAGTPGTLQPIGVGSVPDRAVNVVLYAISALAELALILPNAEYFDKLLQMAAKATALLGSPEEYLAPRARGAVEGEVGLSVDEAGSQAADHYIRGHAKASSKAPSAHTSSSYSITAMAPNPSTTSYKQAPSTRDPVGSNTTSTTTGPSAQPNGTGSMQYNMAAYMPMYGSQQHWHAGGQLPPYLVGGSAGLPPPGLELAPPKPMLPAPPWTGIPPGWYPNTAIPTPGGIGGTTQHFPTSSASIPARLPGQRPWTTTAARPGMPHEIGAAGGNVGGPSFPPGPMQYAPAPPAQSAALAANWMPITTSVPDYYQHFSMAPGLPIPPATGAAPVAGIRAGQVYTSKLPHLSSMIEQSGTAPISPASLYMPGHKRARAATEVDNSPARPNIL